MKGLPGVVGGGGRLPLLAPGRSQLPGTPVTQTSGLWQPGNPTGIWPESGGPRHEPGQAGAVGLRLRPAHLGFLPPGAGSRSICSCVSLEPELKQLPRGTLQAHPSPWAHACRRCAGHAGRASPRALVPDLERPAGPGRAPGHRMWPLLLSGEPPPLRGSHLGGPRFFCRWALAWHTGGGVGARVAGRRGAGAPSEVPRAAPGACAQRPRAG